MRLSHTNKFIFLAYPRTGSRSMRALLDPHAEVQSVHITEISAARPFYHHSPAHYVEGILRAQGVPLEAYFKFGFVRNPFTRMPSLYRHQAEQARLQGRVPASFPEYIAAIYRAYVEGKTSFTHPYDMSSPFEFFSCTRDGKLFFDQVYRHEELPAAVKDIFLRLHLSPGAALPEIGRGSAEDPRVYYDARTRAMVEEIYAREIATYGYSFDDL